MDKVSIIIPARAEKPENLQRTLKSIYENATGEFEVLVGFNGEPFYDLLAYPDLTILPFSRPVGIKSNINALGAMADGKYLIKLDAHTSVGKGFDEILKADMQDDWIITPRFYVLNGETWQWQDDRFYDYFYLSCPFTDPKGFRFKAGGHWPERTKERLDADSIDETPQIHGSCWFMTKDRFFELGGFPLTDPYSHGMEPIHLALRNWLKGGKVMVNKNTHYAHLHQDSKDRGYPEDRSHTEKTYNEVAKHYMGDKESNMIHDMKWFINEKFPGMPGWENWEEYYQLWKEGKPWVLR